MTFARMAVAGLAVVSGLVACSDPVLPRTIVPTLDDAGAAADGFTAIAAGSEHTCALLADSSAACWGSNEFGQVGKAQGNLRCIREDRLIPCEPSPRIVVGGLKFTKIAAGASHSCALAPDARIYCWGDNASGQLGDPSLIRTFTPSPVASAALWVDVAAGDGHTCAIRSDNVAFCWGANDYGQLGNNVSGAGAAVPAVVQTNIRFASIAGGRRRTCGRVADASVYCWGSTWVSRASDGTDVVRVQQTPARVLPAPDMQAISVGRHTTCGLGLDGSGHCWEANSYGTFGDGTTRGSQLPQLVSTTERFVEISVGGTHACGVTDAGVAFCWGSAGFGQLGVSGSSIQRRCRDLPCHLTPVRITGWRTFTHLSAGLGDHACGITTAGNAYCWGAGRLGQRGDGTAASYFAPTRVLPPQV